MTHTYKVSGMTCNKCVQSVKGSLLGIKGIENAEISLEPQKAIITMKYHVNTDDMNKVLSGIGEYKLEEMNVSHSAPQLSSGTNDKKPFLTAYKPILLVFSYIIIVSILKEAYNGSFKFMDFMQTFMGGFFLVFSFFKMLDLKGFAYSYMTYDIIAKRWTGWGYIYPFAELLLGLAYLFNYKTGIANIVTVFVMGISSIGVIQSLLNKRKIQCACLGTVFNLPMSNITLTEDLLMVSMAAVSFAL